MKQGSSVAHCQPVAFRQHLRTRVQILHRIPAHGGGASVGTEGEAGIEVIPSTLEAEMLYRSRRGEL